MIKINLRTFFVVLSVGLHLASAVPFLQYLFNLKFNENEESNFRDLVIKYGKECEEYQVVTEDGYILRLFRIPGDICRPVLLVHGCFDSADSFILRGKKSLAYALAEAGYDVWVCNYRGNKYSRKHVSVDPDRDDKFWDYSFEEIGYYDIPAFIDFILETTGQAKLQTIGYSQGGTVFYVMGSVRPEYNEKIKVLISLAPIAHFYHIKDPVTALFENESRLSNIVNAMGIEEIFGPRSGERAIIDAICWSPLTGYRICSQFLFQFVGYDEDECEPEFYYKLKHYVPNSISKKNAQHLLQLARGFNRFDYGPEKNLEVYNTTSPSKYDLDRVKMKIVLYVSKNDRLSTVEDVEELRNEFNNVVEFRIIERDEFNHLDFVWAKNMDKYIFPHILRALERYNF